MTINEALTAVTAYPVANNTIEKILIDRALTGTDEYSKVIGDSESFLLATADVYYYLAVTPNLVEQEIGISNASSEKQRLLDFANTIYGEYNDPKFTGRVVGFKGEVYNA